ncbi:hypothetical protein [Bacteroides sp.]|uniref:hypothetical protein n=1 Tax=Bacteroides sp. TaxID=29523 RepID=UPI0023CD36DC|nr:hypothetical protein [Bacteroides sp.]MDE6215213.1 hypothetical protein [Bacteroides sp.]
MQTGRTAKRREKDVFSTKRIGRENKKRKEFTLKKSGTTIPIPLPCSLPILQYGNQATESNTFSPADSKASHI